MVGRRVAKLPSAVYGARAYFANRKMPKRKQDLGGHKLLLGNGPLGNIAVMRWMSAVAENAELVYRASSMLLLLAAVRDGLGMCCLPRYLCDKEPALIRAFNVPEETLRGPLDSPPRASSRQRAYASLYRLHAEQVS